jgi:NADPH:quinone reductase-like Zn-dependent oxidoreductase
MARVVVATALGGPEALSVIEEEVGAPGEGEVRLLVRAAGVNPIDWKRYSSAMGSSGALPMRLGSRSRASSRRSAPTRSDRPGRSRWETR